MYRVLVGKPEGRRPLARPRPMPRSRQWSPGGGMWVYGLNWAGLG